MTQEKSILIVDDEKNLADLVKYQLSAHGYHVAVASNGQEALEKLKAFKPDLIILDMNMPVMNGLEFYTRIADGSGATECPVLVLTTRSELEDSFRGIDIAGFLPKPFLVEDLIKEVDRILEI